MPNINQFFREEEEAGVKYDSGKSDYSLIPPHAIEEVVKVLTFGAKKYSPGNWKKLDNAWARYFAAAQRHLWSLQRDEESDPETAYHHAAHAVSCLLFMIEIDKTKNSDIIDTNQLTFNI
jgi:hypothetical protein|tara:strand:- start:3492 stop:3851 length:360 start_codon:yes stop_codon:yes gene_type:complete